MALRSHFEVSEHYESQIRQLEVELWKTRRALIAMLPTALQQVLSSYSACTTSEESRGWADRVVDRIIESARILPPRPSMSLSDRAFCPLCGDGATSPFEEGFALPEGLRRHLLGWGAVRQCAVMAAASGLAFESFGRFRDEDEREREARAEQVMNRKLTERLYSVDPTIEPVLIDEALGYGMSPRDAAAMSWAEARLEALGFEKIVENNVQRYFLASAEVDVLADPRGTGEIRFVVYRKPHPEGKRRLLPRSSVRGRFSLRDAWKRDLATKFYRLLKQSTGSSRDRGA